MLSPPPLPTRECRAILAYGNKRMCRKALSCLKCARCEGCVPCALFHRTSPKIAGQHRCRLQKGLVTTLAHVIFQHVTVNTLRPIIKTSWRKDRLACSVAWVSKAQVSLPLTCRLPQHTSLSDPSPEPAIISCAFDPAVRSAGLHPCPRIVVVVSARTYSRVVDMSISASYWPVDMQAPRGLPGRTRIGRSIRSGPEQF